MLVGDWRRSLPPAENLLILPHLEKSPSRLPPPSFYSPLHQRLIPPLNNPIKTSFLPVVIAPVPFLF